MTRRFGEAFARIFGSALVHGVYAADSRKLSIRAAFPSLWEAEERGWGSVVRGFIRPGSNPNVKMDYDLGNIPQIMKGVSVYSFRGGMGVLTGAMEQYLSNQPNVRILRDTAVEHLHMNPDHSFKVFRSLILFNDCFH